MRTKKLHCNAVIAFIGLLITTEPRACLSISITSEDLNFGVYNPLDNTSLTATFLVTVNCLASGINGLALSYSIGLDSLNQDAGARRTLNFNDNELSYNIYAGPLQSLVWGTLNSNATVNGQFLASPIDQTQFHLGTGVIPANQNIVGGDYVDTLLLTIEF